jgi:hypothetical protein
MSSVPFCAIEDIYTDWNFEKPKQKQQQQQNHPSLKPILKQQSNGPFEKDQGSGDVYIPSNNDIRSFCPNCQNCLNANDVLQQRIIEQNIWPRLRWEPQNPNAYVPFDPFNRYWMNNVPLSHREEFGNIFENFGQPKGITMPNGAINTETLLQIILFILITLFVIQLVECLYMRCT